MSAWRLPTPYWAGREQAGFAIGGQLHCSMWERHPVTYQYYCQLTLLGREYSAPDNYVWESGSEIVMFLFTVLRLEDQGVTLKDDLINNLRN